MKTTVAAPGTVQDATNAAKAAVAMAMAQLGDNGNAGSAGAGGSVLETVTADLYVTGEMRHHDVLAAGERGISVILCEHTNTERGFLGVWQQRLQADLPASVEVVVSGADAEPLQIL